MKKSIFTTVVTLLLLTIATAQTKEEVLDLIAINTCECITAKDIDISTANRTRVEMEFGICLLESFNKNKKAAEKYFEFSVKDESSLETIAELVGIQMVNHCPEIFTAFIEEELEREEEIENITATFISLSTEDFITVKVKDSNTKREHKLLWLTYFEGSELLDNPKELKGKTLEIEFEEYEFYDPKIKEYRNFKVINSLQIVE